MSEPTVRHINTDDCNDFCDEESCWIPKKESGTKPNHTGEGLMDKELDLIERLAEIEHERWSNWHKHAVKNWNVAMVSRWDEQARTPYSELSESEKESDRKEVRKYWPLIQEFIASERAEAGKKIAKLKAEVKEWLCEKCNTVYPGPPSDGFDCVLCRKCNGYCGPRTLIELRIMKRKMMAYREVAIKFRKLWIEKIDPLNEYDASELLVDSQAERLMNGEENI